VPHRVAAKTEEAVPIADTRTPEADSARAVDCAIVAHRVARESLIVATKGLIIVEVEARLPDNTPEGCSGLLADDRRLTPRGA